MSENNDPTPETSETPETTEASDAPPRRTLRDRFAGSGERLRGTRGLIAATLAALIVGGVGGAAIHAAVDGDRHEHGPFLRGPWEMRGEFGGRFDGERPGPPDGFFRQPPGGVPGQLPPTAPPEDEESTPTPTPSESSNS